ncbi:MAG: DUF488 family protein [Methanocorpusculum sp.]|nr:DUF488 family protein [Methanocorpusculum sp.]
MIKRNTRAALYLLSLSDGSMTKIRHMKLLFLASHQLGLYDFIPYKYGPFSYELYNDFKPLQRDGYLFETASEEWRLKDGWPFPKPDTGVRRILTKYYNEYEGITDNELLNRVYEMYPDYSVNSCCFDIKHHYTAKQESGIVTIGYEGKNFDEFLYQLIKNNVDILVDVRRNAYSMKYGFSKAQLKRVFEHFQDDWIEHKMSYIHIPELGIASDKRKDIEKTGYKKLFEEYEAELDTKQVYLDQLIQMSQTKKIALMCFEADVSCCHRGVIAKRMRETGFSVEDI